MAKKKEEAKTDPYPILIRIAEKRELQQRISAWLTSTAGLRHIGGKYFTNDKVTVWLCMHPCSKAVIAPQPGRGEEEDYFDFGSRIFENGTRIPLKWRESVDDNFKRITSKIQSYVDQQDKAK